MALPATSPEAFAVTSPILAVELEDTLAVHDGGYLFDLANWSPRPGARDFLARATPFFEVHVLSSRRAWASSFDDQGLARWCRQHFGAVADELCYPGHLPPAAAVIVSARAVRFRASEGFPDPRLLIEETVRR